MEHGLAFLSNLGLLAKHHLEAPPGCSLSRGFHKGLLGLLVFITLACAAACQLAEVSTRSHSMGCDPVSIPVCQWADGTWRWLGSGRQQNSPGVKGDQAKGVHRRYGTWFLL